MITATIFTGTNDFIGYQIFLGDIADNDQDTIMLVEKLNSTFKVTIPDISDRQIDNIVAVHFELRKVPLFSIIPTIFNNCDRVYLVADNGIDMRQINSRRECRQLLSK